MEGDWFNAVSFVCNDAIGIDRPATGPSAGVEVDGRIRGRGDAPAGTGAVHRRLLLKNGSGAG